MGKLRKGSAGEMKEGEIRRKYYCCKISKNNKEKVMIYDKDPWNEEMGLPFTTDILSPVTAGSTMLVPDLASASTMLLPGTTSAVALAQPIPAVKP